MSLFTKYHLPLGGPTIPRRPDPDPVQGTDVPLVPCHPAGKPRHQKRSGTITVSWSRDFHTGDPDFPDGAPPEYYRETISGTQGVDYSVEHTVECLGVACGREFFGYPLSPATAPSVSFTRSITRKSKVTHDDGTYEIVTTNTTDTVSVDFTFVNLIRAASVDTSGYMDLAGNVLVTRDNGAIKGAFQLRVQALTSFGTPFTNPNVASYFISGTTADWTAQNFDLSGGAGTAGTPGTASGAGDWYEMALTYLPFGFHPTSPDGSETFDVAITFAED